MKNRDNASSQVEKTWLNRGMLIYMISPYDKNFKEKWKILEEPLLEIDSILVNYAKTNEMLFSNVSPEVPSRSLTWGEEIRKKIQIYLEDDEKKHIIFGLWPYKIGEVKDIGKTLF